MGLLVLSAGSLLLCLVVWMSGGVAARLGPLRFRAHTVATPFIVAVVAVLGALLAGGVRNMRADIERLCRAVEARSALVAVLAAAVTLGVGTSWNTWAASGADQSGYVSEAAGWASAHPVLDEPLASVAPWPSAQATFAPLGYRPASRPAAIVPTYPPGFPLLMAVAIVLFSARAAYLVVPLCGALAVWLTAVLGRRLSGAWLAGAAAAVLVATSPVFLYELVQPMSDVPVTAAWLLTLVLALAGRPVAAGVAASIAILIRPNLAPLVAVVAAYLLWSVSTHETRSPTPPARAGESLPRTRRLLRRTAGWRFLAATAPGVALLAVINWYLYGSPLRFGYDPPSALFAWTNIAENLSRYPSWLLDTQTAIVFVPLLLPLAWAFPQSRRAAGFVLADNLAGIFCLVFAAAVFSAYVAYAPFSDWWYLRFLLPALPVLLGLVAAMGCRAVSAAHVSIAIPAVIVSCTLLASWQVATATERDAFRLQRLDARYVDTARYVMRATPSTGVVFASQHSGSMRFYTKRPIVRWDLLDPAWLDRSLAYLARRGHQPVMVVEAWEEPVFRRRFAGSPFGALDWPPVADIGRSARVRVYDPADRARFLAGEHLTTVRIR